ncbi:hypothetical protein [Streptomyces sp. AMCC400023]|uniref:hypothetical protein n=1 Tax=Streptomyces sp. AMCC400023 TaxID=2056258 RepID=UPI001F1A5BE8|nr:hypothetical protein [Streptomyces sp. AMCC400023]
MPGLLTAAPPVLDIVVPVREEPANESLRYALRSWAAHLPHRRVWTVGHRHRWLTDEVGHIPTVQSGGKFANTDLGVRAACAHPEVSDPFLLADDDMFTMRPLPGGMPVLHRGLVVDVERHYEARGSGVYLRGMRETRALLAGLGHTAPLSYELHVPLAVGKATMLNALWRGRHLDVLHKRTLYGVIAGIGGEQVEDVKIRHRAPRGYGPADTFLSTMPDSFVHGHVGKFIRAAFPLPSPYERHGRR